MSRVLYLGWFLWWLAASDASVLTKQFVQVRHFLRLFISSTILLTTINSFVNDCVE